MNVYVAQPPPNARKEGFAIHIAMQNSVVYDALAPDCHDRFGNFRLIEVLLDRLPRKVASTHLVILRFSRSISSNGSPKYPRTCRNETDIVTAWRSMK